MHDELGISVILRRSNHACNDGLQQHMFQLDPGVWWWINKKKRMLELSCNPEWQICDNFGHLIQTTEIR